MNMLYKDGKLYVDMIGKVTEEEVSIMEEKLFNTLDIYYVNNIIINVDNLFELNKNIFNRFLDDYHNRFSGTITINNR